MPHVIYKGIHYPIRASETILEGLLAGGADARYSCQRGSCHTCILQSDPALVARLPKNRLPPSLRAAGMFLPCVTHCDLPLELRPPDWSSCFVEGMVAKKDHLAGGLVRLSIDVPPQWQWHAGQYVYLRSPDGEARPYSIASVRAIDYHLELHIRCYDAGQVSRWVADELEVYDVVQVRGPLGSCHYRPDFRTARLLLLATGTGAGAALALAREAKLCGHTGAVHLVHGARNDAGLYLTASLRDLADDWAAFEFTCCCTESSSSPHVVNARVTDVAFEHHDAETQLFLFGHPAMVDTAAKLALEIGLPEAAIHADAFVPHAPHDESNVASSGT